MKVRTRLIPKDEISIEEGARTIHIFTHGNTIVLDACVGVGSITKELTFDQLHALIRGLNVEGIKP